MAKTLPAKDPDEVFDYRWTVTLSDGDALTAAAEIALVDGTVTIESQVPDTTGITFWISGGADGESAELRATGPTTSGRTIEETLILPIVSTASDSTFIAAFPSFAAVSGASIAYWMSRASRIVDDGWPDGDRDHARMLLTAHLLTQQGQGASAEAEAFASGAARFKRIRSGALDLDQFDQSNEDDLSTTTYGRQFKALLQIVKGGPRVTATGSLPWGTVPGFGFGFGFGRIPGW